MTLGNIHITRVIDDILIEPKPKTNAFEAKVKSISQALDLKAKMKSMAQHQQAVKIISPQHCKT